MTRSTAALVAALLLLGAFSEARAQARVSGRVRYTWTRLSSGSDPEFMDSMAQDYQLNYRNMVARNLSWQARLRALFRGNDTDEISTNSDTTLLEPFLQVVYEGPRWTASGGGRMTRVTPKGDRSTAESRERRQFFGAVGWSDEVLDAKRLTANWTFNRFEDQEEEVDTSVDDRSILTVGFRADTAGLTLSVQNRTFDDLLTGFERDFREYTGSGDFRHRFPGARLTVSGRALASVQDRVDRTPQALDVLEERMPRAGLFGVDNSPEADLLPDAPGLIDGDETTAVADLDGRDRNFGIDLGFPKEVETFFLILERRLVTGNERDYSWEIYSSADGDQWQVVQALGSLVASCRALDDNPGSFCFEPLRNRFEIRLSQPVQARFIKVVAKDVSTSEVPLGVTEMRVYGLEQRVGRAEFDATRQSGNLALGWRPADPLTFNLNVRGSRQTNDRGGEMQEEEDFSSTFGSTYRSRRNVTTIVRLQAFNRNSTNARPERDRTASLTLAGSPVPDLDMSATGTRRRNRTPDGLIAASDALDLRTAARIASHTRTSLDVAFVRTEQPEIDRITDRRSGRVSLVTTLRPGLLLTNDLTTTRWVFDVNEVTQSRTDHNLRASVSYRPTSVFGGTLTLVYQDVADRSATSRFFDLDWLPFPGGALQLQMRIVRDELGESNATRDEERYALRWTLNPRTQLESSYTVARRADENAESTSRSVRVFLEFRF